jgi:plasmid replication initiation protein
MEIIKQSNYITNARYNFSDYEIKVLIHVVKDIQQILSSEKPDVQKNLLGEIDHKVYFTLASIDADNPKRIREALKMLLTKTIEIDDEDGWTMVNFISRAKYITSAKKYEIKIDECLMPYMISLAKGFTLYQLESTMLLNGNAKRLYFLFSEFANTGVFRIDADKLKTNMGLSDSYKQYDDFKRSVLTRAIKEINALAEQGKCDLFVEIVNDKKERNKLDWDRTIEFRIASKRKKSIVPIPHEHKVEIYQEVAGMLTAIYKNDFALCEKITAHFANRADLPKFHKELCRNVEKSENAIPYKPLTGLGGLIRSIARKHFEFEKDFKPKAEKNEVNLVNELSNKWNFK